MKKLLTILMLTLTATFSMAETFPTKPVKIVLCVGVGSGLDVVARKMAEILSEKWNQPVLIENKPGGGGGVGLNYLAGEATDGHTIGFLDGGTVISYPIMYSGQNTDIISKFEPVLPMIDATMAVFASGEISNFAELKKEIAKNPSYGSWNIGSAGHVIGAEFGNTIMNRTVHVPYKDFGIWQADVASRRLAYSVGSTGTTKALVQSGRNKLIAVAASNRDPRYPTIPTIKELTGREINTLISWAAFYVPTSAPRNNKTKLEQDLRAAAADQRVREILEKLDYIDLHKMSISDFNQKIKQETKDYQSTVKKFNINTQ